MKKLAIIAAATAILLSACAPVPEAVPDEEVDFPTSGATIELIVPFSAGGGTDISARAIAPLLAAELGADVQVINTPGAGSQLGITALSTAKADGYTIGFTTLPSALTTYLVENRGATYDRSSFVPLGSLTKSSNIIAVSASSDFESMEDLIAAAEAAPGSVTVAVAGDDERLGMRAVEDATGATFNLVPFDGGAEKTTALLGNQVQAIIGGATTVVPGVTNGDFRALAIFGAEEDPFLEGIPTLSSLGIDIEINGFLVISAPAGTPDGVVELLEAAIKKATADPAFQELVSAGFQQPVFLPSAQVAEIWETQEAAFIQLLADEGTN